MHKTVPFFERGALLLWNEVVIKARGGISSKKFIGAGPFRVVGISPCRLPRHEQRESEQLEFWGEEGDWLVTIVDLVRSYPHSLIFWEGWFKEASPEFAAQTLRELPARQAQYAAELERLRNLPPGLILSVEERKLLHKQRNRNPPATP